jgi:protein-S-isoprenylcysteine O-methyltransferase Ste14
MSKMPKISKMPKMSKAAFTIETFGYYLLLLGVVVILVPNIFLAMFHIPATSEVWIRVAGVLVFNIGIYYLYAAKCEATAFFQASIYTRMFVLLAFTIFVTLGLASPKLILLSFGDVLGAIWTYMALKKEP